jgi:hypothetical protein
MGFWTTYKQGINTNSQLLFHASYRTNERLKVNGSSSEFINADTLVGGVRLLSGDRNFRFSLETTYNRESPSGGKANNDYLYYGYHYLLGVLQVDKMVAMFKLLVG